MAYYEVTVYEDDFKVDCGSEVEAARAGRDAWRERNRDKMDNDFFRIPEPLGVVVKLIGTGMPVQN